MNILVPASWLRDYLKTDITAKSLANIMSLCGPSVERMEKHGEDVVFDVEVTTNRPDANSIYGIAREASAILNWNKQKAHLVSPDGLNLSLHPDKKELLNLDVQITNSKLCPRFTAVVMDNVEIKDSPALIKSRLEKCGIRPINNIVDISNYLMLELGQPMHMFDYDKIKGAKMVLRESKAGESIRTLDGQNRKLPSGTIVIEDSERLVDLCGIMGGENSAVSKRTKRIIVFVQSYDALRIRKTTQALAFRTDAAARFEKGVDAGTIPQVLARAVFMCKNMAGGQIASELVDIYPNPPKTKSIELSEEKLDKYLGIAFKLSDAQKILSLLGFKVTDFGKYLKAIPPSWRAVDVEQEEDLIEEVARIYGYHNLPSDQPRGIVPNEPETDLMRVIKLKKSLKDLGLTETLSYSIISEEFLGLTGLGKEQAVELNNPLSNEWQYMRPTLLISLASVVAQNQNLFPDIHIFEIAKTYIKGTREAIVNDLPIQDLHLSVALGNSDFYKVKGYVENIFQILGREVEFVQLQDCSLADSLGYQTILHSLLVPQISAVIKSEGVTVGVLGILNREVNNYFGIKDPIAVCEINLATTYSLQGVKLAYHPIAKYPPVIEDISAIFQSSMMAGDIIAEVKGAGSPLVKKVEIIDVYRDEKLGRDNKSVTLRINYQMTERTPSNAEVVPVREKIISHLESALGAKVRK